MNIRSIIIDQPPVGWSLSIAGQRFVCAGSTDHVRQDGAIAKLVLWVGACVVCGADFPQSTAQGRLPENRRCKAHAKPGART